MANALETHVIGGNGIARLRRKQINPVKITYSEGINKIFYLKQLVLCSSSMVVRSGLLRYARNDDTYVYFFLLYEY